MFGIKKLKSSVGHDIAILDTGARNAREQIDALSNHISELSGKVLDLQIQSNRLKESIGQVRPTPNGCIVYRGSVLDQLEELRATQAALVRYLNVTVGEQPRTVVTKNKPIDEVKFK